MKQVTAYNFYRLGPRCEHKGPALCREITLLRSGLLALRFEELDLAFFGHLFWAEEHT